MFYVADGQARLSNIKAGTGNYDAVNLQQLNSAISAIDFSGYVPYAGATTNLNLGLNSLIGSSVILGANSWIYGQGTSADNYIEWLGTSNSISLKGATLSFVGDIDTCSISYDDAENLLIFGDSDITTDGDIFCNKLYYNSLSPAIDFSGYVTYTGAIDDVDLGVNNLDCYELNVNGNNITFGDDSESSSTRNTIKINNDGFSTPTGVDVDSAGEKIIIWDSTLYSIKTAIGFDYSKLWFQSSGNSSSKISFYTIGTTSTPAERMFIDADGDVTCNNNLITECLDFSTINPASQFSPMT